MKKLLFIALGLLFSAISYAQIEHVTTGPANAYLLDYPSTLTAISTGLKFTFKVHLSNTGAATLNINSIGAKDIVKDAVIPLVANDLLTGQFITLVYDGAKFQMITLTGNSSIDENGIYSGGGTLNTDVTVNQNGKTLSFTSAITNAYSIDGSTFSVDANNNRVGIGTTAPSQAFHVFGNSVFENTGNNRKLTIDGNGEIETTSNQTLHLNRTQANNVTIALAGGKVGIGKSPSSDLDVSGITTTDSLIVSTGAGTSGHVLTNDGTGNAVWQAANSGGWGLTGNAGTTNGTNFIGTTDTQDLDIRTNNVIKHRFTQKGQIEFLNTGRSVFIGEQAGENDDLTTNNNVFIGYSAGSDNTSANRNVAIGNYALNAVTTGANNTAVGYQAISAGNGVSNSAFGYAALTNGSGGNNAAFGASSLTNSTSGTRNSAFGSQSLLSTTTGIRNTAVGFGALQTNIVGNESSAVGMSALINSIGNNNSALGYEAGDVITTGTNNTFIGHQANAGAGLTGLSNATAIGSGAIVSQSNSLVLGNGTKVGINTSTPTQLLDVVGTAEIDSLRINNSYSLPKTVGANGEILALNGSDLVWQAASSGGWGLTGNAGTTNGTNFIGTTDTQDLDIRTNNVIKHRFTQKGQIEFLNTGNSVFIGEGAGNNDDLTTNNNVFVGKNAGLANSAGSNNTAIGSQSMAVNTSGNNNIAIGSQSFASNVSGSNNVAIGKYALNNNTNHGNTAVGYDAMKSNTSGFQNVAFGYQALRNNLTSTSNSAFGYQALLNTTGQNNTGLGLYAGLVNTTGSNNTFIGHAANAGAGLTGLSNATAIGSGATVSASNSLILGNNANVGIGTSSPSEKLHIQSNTFVQMLVRNSSNNIIGTGVTMSKSRGTENTPSAVQSGDRFGDVTFQGYDGSDYESGAWIRGVASENWTAGGRGTNLQFTTAANGTTSYQTRMIILNSGNVGIGTSSPSEKLDVDGGGSIEVDGDYTYEGAKTHYLAVAPSNFTSNATIDYDMGRNVNAESATMFTYFINGTTGILGYASAAVSLPDGAVVTNLTAYIYRNGGNAALHPRVRLVRKIYAGFTSVVMAEVQKTVTNTTISQVTDNTIASATIDNDNYVYSLVFRADQNTSHQRIYGVKITYTVLKAD